MQCIKTPLLESEDDLQRDGQGFSPMVRMLQTEKSNGGSEVNFIKLTQTMICQLLESKTEK